MKRRLYVCLGLLFALGLATPALAAGDPPPPPPIDWADFINGQSETPTDAIVGEEMC